MLHHWRLVAATSHSTMVELHKTNVRSPNTLTYILALTFNAVATSAGDVIDDATFRKFWYGVLGVDELFTNSAMRSYALCSATSKLPF